MGGIATIVILSVVISLFIVFEKSEFNSKYIAVISTLSAIAAVGRIPFAGIPSVQPTTFIVIISGWAFGPLAGFVVGGTAAFVSNFFLGQGPWTPWQMMAWGMAGASAGMFGRLSPNIGRLKLVVFCSLWGYIFGCFMNLWTWISYTYPHDLKAYLLLCTASFWFDTLHAVGNAVLAWMFGKEFLNIILRFKKKMTVKYIDYQIN